MIGYAEEYELMHFVYDLAMWSNLGGTPSASVPLRSSQAMCVKQLDGNKPP